MSADHRSVEILLPREATAAFCAEWGSPSYTSSARLSAARVPDRNLPNASSAEDTRQLSPGGFGCSPLAASQTADVRPNVSAAPWADGEREPIWLGSVEPR
jgi:hypothetical protein